MLLAMGNREALLAGAKRCLIEKGYARTTARDIAAASGVSLAAIGYHFGSKDALMNQAIYEFVGEWGDEVERALSAEGALDAEPLKRFESIMARTIESISPPAACTVPGTGSSPLPGLVVTSPVPADDVQPVPRVDHGDGAHQRGELVIVVVLGRVRPGVVGVAAGGVGDAGALLGELERGPLGLGEDLRLPPH